MVGHQILADIAAGRYRSVPVFDDAVLGTVSMVDLLTQPVAFLADRWKS